MTKLCSKCHRVASLNRWNMNGQEYEECGRCGFASPSTIAPEVLTHD